LDEVKLSSRLVADKVTAILPQMDVCAMRYQ
jgi:hypothetical protein